MESYDREGKRIGRGVVRLGVPYIQNRVSGSQEGGYPRRQLTKKTKEVYTWYTPENLGVSRTAYL